MLSIETILDRKTMTKIMRSGHSRIPIFDGPADQPLDQRNIIGVLLVKVRKLLTSVKAKKTAIHKSILPVPYSIGP